MFLPNLNKTFKLLGLSASLFVSSNWAQANEFYTHPNYFAFKQKAMSTYNLTSEQIDAAMSGAKDLPNILNIMTRPGESKPWYEYRSMFLVDGTIQRGANFKNQYQDALNRAEQQFGVPKTVILGILGVETGYGANKALSSLEMRLQHSLSVILVEQTILVMN